MCPNRTHLVLRVEQFELIVDKAILGDLLFAQRSLLLQFGRPKRFDAVHRAAQLLVRQV